MYLSVPLPPGQGPFSLQQCLRLYCKKERLDIDNRWLDYDFAFIFQQVYLISRFILFRSHFLPHPLACAFVCSLTFSYQLFSPKGCARSANVRVRQRHRQQYTAFPQFCSYTSSAFLFLALFAARTWRWCVGRRVELSYHFGCDDEHS